MILIATKVKVATLVGTGIMLPFLFLEIYNRHQYSEPFPVMLFAILWFALSIAIFLLHPIIKIFQTGISDLSAINIVIRSVAIISLTVFCLMIIVDQMPCFLGVENCD
jgi:hypothetical protein